MSKYLEREHVCEVFYSLLSLEQVHSITLQKLLAGLTTIEEVLRVTSLHEACWGQSRQPWGTPAWDAWRSSASSAA